ncbi:hypothetical protein BDV95DRAFT_665622 [Massariosphaeria phaeospora]|uniref:DUF7730 domain-containing protein n=1 Tax=Massariosphaeria phaeospora TaxID=100035 RepID=A0A7C8IAU8_9PLEO|nr:hypothetical protein BDV95DRAFT_665622 [Massariosphaeria phaeospora]
MARKKRPAHDPAHYSSLPKKTPSVRKRVRTRYHVKVPEDGLCSTENTPDYLLPVVERNARESPLLSLPAEIRNQIYQYAMGGSEINVTRARPTNHHPDWRKRSKCLFWHGRATHLEPFVRSSPEGVGTSFHFPETCRQVYAETVTLGYSTNLFIFGFEKHYPDTMRLWKSQASAQRQAITAIRPHYSHFSIYFDDRNCPDTLLKLLKPQFPGLEQISVPKDFMVDHHWRRHVSMFAMEPAKSYLRDKIMEEEGAGMEVVFEN